MGQPRAVAGTGMRCGSRFRQQGCDGSILIDSTAGNTAEKDSPASNPSLSGFDIIEAICPGVVSCADIVAYAARDSAHERWIPRASDIPGNLPPPSFDVNRLTQLFAQKQLSKWAHSIVVSHCSSFSADRLYNFSGRGVQDPSMDPSYALQLKAKCPASSSSYSRGLLRSDQTLMSNDVTSRLVRINAKYPAIWRRNFGRAMVLRGSQGEARIPSFVG
ncbi:peroxidase 5-like [Cryptomeria japonica]|uniref:peroxidase 5-like n=1 Tax=Cryptomeria japonica TaxID=3369 RepID=UPI0027DA2DE7|nr:peroxidase 5-like [Cryptomeria japonica]